MTEFSELIKRFDKIRNYMRDFYVYGFKTREDFDKKSLRSYDNEKRRIESYLSDVMTFRQDENGKNVFISVDSAQISKNPLYRAFKAKTFTKNDIALHFFIIDILTQKDPLSASEIADIIANEYLIHFENPTVLDLSTVRNKLKEYEVLGVLESKQQGRKLVFALNKSNANIESSCDALAFFSEISPLGVIGSFLLDRCHTENTYLTFKHHYIMHALESEIVERIVDAIQKKCDIEIVNFSMRTNKEMVMKVTPLKFLISVQGGRRYLSCFSIRTQRYINYRLDYIKDVKILDANPEFNGHYERLDQILSKTWGASFGKAKSTEKLTMTLHIPLKERYIASRIQREGRNGVLRQIDETTYTYQIEVFDAMEMMPWIRTFIGRIIRLECDNQEVADVFYKDLNQLYELYSGGQSHVV